MVVGQIGCTQTLHPHLWSFAFVPPVKTLLVPSLPPFVWLDYSDIPSQILSDNSSNSKFLIISPSDKLDPLLTNEDLLSTAPLDDKTIIKMDEDLYGPKDEDILWSFPPPPIDHDTYTFLEDLANSVDATWVRIPNTAKPRQHYIELTSKDWLNWMWQKTIPYSCFQLCKPVINGKATALALQVEAILEQQQTRTNEKLSSGNGAHARKLKGRTGRFGEIDINWTKRTERHNTPPWMAAGIIIVCWTANCSISLGDNHKIVESFVSWPETQLGGYGEQGIEGNITVIK